MAKRPVFKLSRDAQLELDGDVVYLIDMIYREVAVKQGLEHTYDDIRKTLEKAWRQMDDRTRKEYFLASLFLNYVNYENEMLDQLATTIQRRARGSRARQRS